MTTPTLAAHPAPDLEPGQTILEMRGLEKKYPGTHALKPIDLAFEPGEIHAIVGENGAGKSTLIKLLTGVIPRTSGEVIWEGKPVALATPHEAMSLGINAVHQEVVLCRHLTVAANMFLGEENVRHGLLQQRAMLRDAQKIIDDLGFDLPAHVMLGGLTIGQQQLIAAARATASVDRVVVVTCDEHVTEGLRGIEVVDDPDADLRSAILAGTPPLARLAAASVAAGALITAGQMLGISRRRPA